MPLKRIVSQSSSRLFFRQTRHNLAFSQVFLFVAPCMRTFPNYLLSFIGVDAGCNAGLWRRPTWMKQAAGHTPSSRSFSRSDISTTRPTLSERRSFAQLRVSLFTLQTVQWHLFCFSGCIECTRCGLLQVMIPWRGVSVRVRPWCG